MRPLHLSYPGVVKLRAGATQWDFITAIIGGRYPSLTVAKELYGYSLIEQLEEISFEFVKYNKGFKSTKYDQLGFVGFSLINLEDPTIVMTEGVSDYLSVKACNPHLNVIGLLNLAGNRLARTFLVSCFRNFVYIHDNDAPGIQAARRLESFLREQVSGAQVILIKPNLGYKDAAEQIFTDYKLRHPLEY
jgi:hypothetical protein